VILCRLFLKRVVAFFQTNLPLDINFMVHTKKHVTALPPSCLINCFTHSCVLYDEEEKYRDKQRTRNM